MPDPVFDVPAVLARVAEERITCCRVRRRCYQAILDHPDRDKFDLSSLRLTVTGAAAVPVELIRRLREELTFETIVTGYGLTETTGTVTMCRHDDDPETIAHTSGRAIPEIEVRIVDDDGKEVPSGEPGEIVVPRVQRDARLLRRARGRHASRRSTPTAGCTPATSASWTIAAICSITDRKKDMFIVGGFNAYPAEIENLLLAHPTVAQVAVVGIPDDRMGEVGDGVRRAAPRRHGRPRRADRVGARRDGQLQGAARAVRSSTSCRSTPAGKVLKYELREQT